MRATRIFVHMFAGVSLGSMNMHHPLQLTNIQLRFSIALLNCSLLYRTFSQSLPLISTPATSLMSKILVYYDIPHGEYLV